MYTFTLDTALDAVMHLPPDEQDMLVDIVRNRRIDDRRASWFKEAEETLAAYQRGEIHAMTAQEAIIELRKELVFDLRFLYKP